MLTGKPTETDTVLFSIPMCAPYSSLMCCNYKIKLQPGTQRKGKGKLLYKFIVALGTIKELFMKNPELPNREKEIIKNVADEDCLNCLVGNVKVVAAGLFDLKSKKHQKKKQQRKDAEKKEAKVAQVPAAKEEEPEQKKTE